MRTTITAFLAALILPGLSMAAADEAKTITATHTLGTVELPVNPKRVAVLDYGSLETIGELGVTPALALPKNSFLLTFPNSLENNIRILERSRNSILKPSMRSSRT